MCRSSRVWDGQATVGPGEAPHGLTVTGHPRVEDIVIMGEKGGHRGDGVKTWGKPKELTLCGYATLMNVLRTLARR